MGFATRFKITALPIPTEYYPFTCLIYVPSVTLPLSIRNLITLLDLPLLAFVRDAAVGCWRKPTTTLRTLKAPVYIPIFINIRIQYQDGPKLLHFDF
jgi:hypothetical protein